jgi:hypothetical protein
VECDSASDTVNNWGDWNHFKITQTVLEQHKEKREIKELQKTGTLSAAHRLQEVLM